MASTTADIIRLRNGIRSCTACGLHLTAKRGVPWSGPISAHYLFIGMAPGVQEDKEGRPFVGASGNLLRYILKEKGFPLADVAFANAVSCFPGRVKGGDAKPTPDQLSACRPWLRAQIDVINPSYIFLVGGTALEAFRPDLSLAHVHGKPLFYDGVDLEHKPETSKVIWTIYHPAAALRSKKYERMLRDDLATFQEWLTQGQPWPEFCYICGKDVEEYDRWGFPYCKLHTMRQQSLFQS